MQPPPGVVRLGRIHAHALSFRQAVDAIESLCRDGSGGYVVTPNVDHVVLAEEDDRFAEAYESASLSLVDGMPLVWWSKALGRSLPEKISGSDLVRPLMTRAAGAGLSVFFLGGREGVGRRAAEILREENPTLSVAGVLAPPIGFDADPVEDAMAMQSIRRAAPSLVLVALGAPRQELWMQKHCDELAPAILVGIGSALDFLAGVVPRAPRWMSQGGLEWLYRLAHEPRRLSHRYLVRDRAIVRIAARDFRRRTRERLRTRRGAPERMPEQITRMSGVSQDQRECKTNPSEIEGAPPVM